MLYKLQNELTLLTGEDPLKDKHVSFIGPQVSPYKISRQVHDGMDQICNITSPYCFYHCAAKRSLYIRSSNAGTHLICII